MVVVNRLNWQWYVENKKRGRPGYFAYCYDTEMKWWVIISANNAKLAEKAEKEMLENPKGFEYFGSTSIATFPAELVRQLQNKVLADCDFYLESLPHTIDLLQYVERFPE